MVYAVGKINDIFVGQGITDYREDDGQHGWRGQNASGYARASSAAA